MSCCDNTNKQDCTPQTSGASANAGARSERMSLGGSVVAAVLSSACCWLPLLLLAFGASAAGVSTFFERWRPAFLIVAVGLLAAGFYLVYSRRAPVSVCADGTCAAAPRSRRVFSRVMLWIAAALVAGFALFPNFAGTLAAAIHPAPAQEPGTAIMPVHRYAVGGMSCEACAVTLRAELESIPGVTGASVDYASKSAEVRSGAADLDTLVVAAAARHGYSITPR